MIVYVMLADGFEEIEALTVVDLLRRADIDTETVSIHNQLKITGSHGVEVIADILFEDAVFDNCEMIVLPGGGGGAKNLAAHDGLREKLYSFAKSGRRISAICASPAVVLAPLGILKGKNATCFPSFSEEMAGEIGTAITPGSVVKDENFITSRGPAQAIDFALAIIESLKGSEAAEEISKAILYK